MASGPRFGKIAAIGLGCFLALGVVTARFAFKSGSVRRRAAPGASRRRCPRRCTFPPRSVAWSTVAACALAKLLKDAGGLGDAFLQEQLTIASHPSSANEQRTLPKKNTFTRQQLSKQSKTYQN